MFANRLKRGLRRLFNSTPKQRQNCLAAAVIETLEQRQLLSFTVTHQPYLQLGNAPLVGSTNYAGNDQIEIIWQTSGAADVGEQFIAEYRVSGAGGWTSAGTPVVAGSVTIGGAAKTNRSVTITGLSFNTSYEYRITHDRPAPAADTVYQYTFQTRLAPGSSTGFTFAAYGDSADSGHIGDFQSVMNRINTVNPAFSVLLGDNAYDSGSYDQLEYRLNPAMAGTAPTNYIRTHIDYPTYGNHDVGNGGNPDSQNVSGAPGQPSEYSFDVPVPSSTTSLVPAPAGTRAEHNYSFDYGGVHFVSIEGNYCDVPLDDCYDNNSTTLDAELDWAVNDLKESDAKWKIVMVHQPVFSLRGHTNLNLQTTYYNKMVSRLGKDGGGADLLLAGHAHNYQRSYPLVGPYDDGLGHYDTTATSSTYTKGTGLTQVIAGLGGHAIDSAAAGTLPNFLAKVLSGTSGATAGAYSFLKIDVTSSSLTLTQVKASDGSTMDTFTINAPNDTTAPTASLAGPLDNGTTDSDADPDEATVTASQAAFIIKLKDSGDGINDSSPASSSTVTLKKDGITLVSGTDYTYSYDGATNRAKLTAIGASFSVGAYEITVNGGIVADTHGTPNVMSAKTFTVNIESQVNTAALIAKGSSWKYLGNTAAPAGWNGTSFNDAAWTASSTGTTPLGYGPLNENGLNVTGRDLALPASGSRYTSYFRKSFTISEANKILSLVVNLNRDDGAIVYLNGTEVIRTSNMAPGAPTFTTLANYNGASAIDGSFETSYFPYRINAGLLVNGTNVIAVEVHQQANTSGDLAFDLELLGPTAQITQTYSSGALVINGTTRNDLMDVSYDGTYVTVHGVRYSPIAPAASVTSILVNGRAGNDTIDLSLVNTAHGFTESALFGHITVQGDAGDDIITGSNIVSAGVTIDRLFGGNGNDNINGGAGNDILVGGAGADILTGGADNDTADYSSNTSTQGISINLNGSADDADGLGGTDNVNVETVLGGAGNDAMIGGSGGEYLKGNDGSDTIDGGGGDDTIYGDGAYDRIHGGDGNDSIHGGAGGDALFGDREAYGGPGSPGNDVIWGDEDNDDMIGGHWAITSNDGNDRMYGGSGSDRFYFYGGNQGNDLVGDDQQDVPTDTDWIIFSNWSNSIILHLDSFYIGTQQFLSGGGSINVAIPNSIENIWGSSGNDYLFGDDRNNYLDGQGGDDYIQGGGGNDALAGYDGYDVLYGGPGDDVMWPEYGGGEMHGEDGNDTYDFVMTWGTNYYVYEYAIGGSDNSSDTLDFRGASGPVNINLASTSPQAVTSSVTLTLSDGTGIENVYCSLNAFFNWGDTLYGNSRPNVFMGGVGNDTMYGYDGHDLIYGEDGNDFIYLGNNNDQAYGGPGNDYIDGGADGGVDVLYGEDGSDSMYGNAGNDVLDAGDGYDQLFGGDDNDTFFAGSDGWSDGIYGGQGDDTLYGNDASDSLSSIEHRI